MTISLFFAAMFQLLAHFTKLTFNSEGKKVSGAPAIDYLSNTEGNNGQNKLKQMGLNVDEWPGLK